MNKLTAFQLGQRLRENLLSGVPISGSVRDSSTMSESEFKQSLALGLVSPVVFHAEAVSGEPVAYLYNGVRLPPLPVVEGLPYAYTSGWFEPSSTSGTLCYLWLISDPLINTSGGTISVPVGSYFAIYQCKKDTDYWELHTPKKQQPEGYSTLAKGEVPWTNHDILNVPFGHVFMAASDPIPVYE